MRGCLLYTFLFGALGSVPVYLPLFFYNEGALTGFQTGVLLAARPFVSAISSPALGIAADRWRGHNGMLFVGALVAVTATAAMLHADGRFGVLLGLCICASVGMSAVVPIVDSAMVSLARLAWGRLRLWGAVGFGLAALASGALLEVTHRAWAPLMLLYAALMTVAVAMAFTLDLSGDGKEGTVRMHSNAVEGEAVPTCAANEEETHSLPRPRIAHRDAFLEHFFCAFKPLATLGSILVGGIGAGAIDGFLYVFLVEELDAPPLLLGLSRLLTCVSELPVFHLGERLMSLLGTSGMLALSMVTYCVRMLWYAGMGVFKVSPWVVLPAEVLHGITFACLWISATQWARATAPPGRETSAQGLVEGVHWGMGQGLGCLVGGLIYGATGGVVLWLGSAGLAVVGLILSIIGAERGVEVGERTVNSLLGYSPLEMAELSPAPDPTAQSIECELATP